MASEGSMMAGQGSLYTSHQAPSSPPKLLADNQNSACHSMADVGRITCLASPCQHHMISGPTTADCSARTEGRTCSQSPMVSPVVPSSCRTRTLAFHFLAFSLPDTFSNSVPVRRLPAE